MSIQPRPYGIRPVLDIVNKLIVPVLLMLIGWAFHELKVLGEAARETKQWRESIPKHMQVESDKLKLEILREVSITLGSSLGKVQEGQARIEERIKSIDEKLEMIRSASK